jgi:hypothetical protein
MCEQISTYDWLINLGYNEWPSYILAQANVEGHQPLTIDWDAGTIGGTQVANFLISEVS